MTAFRNLREQTVRILEAARSDAASASLPALLAAREPLLREFAAARAGGASAAEFIDLQVLEAEIHRLVTERRDRAARELTALRRGRHAAGCYGTPATRSPGPGGVPQPRFLDRTH